MQAQLVLKPECSRHAVHTLFERERPVRANKRASSGARTSGRPRECRSIAISDMNRLMLGNLHQSTETKKTHQHEFVGMADV